MENLLSIIKNDKITFEQKVVSLARYAESFADVLNMDEDTKEYISEGVICDLNEGNAPYRPRYILPDYEKFMKNGSKFLNLTPAENIFEAINNLLILYKHVPSITTMPVYLGNIDYLLEPYVKDEAEATLAIKLFLKHIDSTITDSFCHGNIGPKETKAGKIILNIMRELELPTPNLTLKYSEDTSDSFAIDAISTGLITAKPSFANNKMFTEDFRGEYGIVSCYNGLKIGGGANTLVRARLGKLSQRAKDIDDFFNSVLPMLTASMLSYIDKRSKFIIEESNFFESNFLVREGLLEKEKFSGLFGIVGLAECVNNLLKVEKLEDKFGYSSIANELGDKIVREINRLISLHKSPYAGEYFNNLHLFHSQVGIETDKNESPGCRIPVGEEPEIFEHIMQSAPFHKYFPSGVGDIFVFDETYKRNPKAILDIIKGAFANNMRFFSYYCTDCDVVRITGYLVKKSEIEKLERGEVVLRDTTILGKGTKDHGKALDRKIRS